MISLLLTHQDKMFFLYYRRAKIAIYKVDQMDGGPVWSQRLTFSQETLKSKNIQQKISNN